MSEAHTLRAFLQRMRELGYVEGHNIVIERRSAEGKWDRLPDLASDLVRLKVDVIVVAPGWAAVEAHKATEAIPIVFVAGTDASFSTLVASLARPGGNVTGISELGEDLSGKRLELLKETVPTAASVAVLFNPGNPSHPPMLKETEMAAQRLGVKLQIVEARSPSEFASALSLMRKGGARGLLVLPDSIFYVHRGRIAALATRHQLPTMFEWREAVEAGALMSYGPSLLDEFRRAATFVDKILRGAKPGDLPVEQVSRFELVLNLKTAKALGLTIPQSVLVRADELIK